MNSIPTFLMSLTMHTESDFKRTLLTCTLTYDDTHDDKIDAEETALGVHIRAQFNMQAFEDSNHTLNLQHSNMACAHLPSVTLFLSRSFSHSLSFSLTHQFSRARALSLCLCLCLPPSHSVSLSLPCVHALIYIYILIHILIDVAFITS